MGGLDSNTFKFKCEYIRPAVTTTTSPSHREVADRGCCHVGCYANDVNPGFGLPDTIPQFQYTEPREIKLHSPTVSKSQNLNPRASSTTIGRLSIPPPLIMARRTCPRSRYETVHHSHRSRHLRRSAHPRAQQGDSNVSVPFRERLRKVEVCRQERTRAYG